MSNIEKILDQTGTTVLGRQGSITEWFLGLLLIIVFSFIYRSLFIKYSNGIGNKKAFSSIFFLFSLAIYLIISSIKASLVLSLGLVGALSVVRFRNAIKDTEQIIYLLFLIALSLSIAANQYLLGVISGVIGIIYLTLNGIFSATPIETATVYAEFEKAINVHEALNNLTRQGNTIISINNSSETLIICATFNNISESELIVQMDWLKSNTKEYRISSNQTF